MSEIKVNKISPKQTCTQLTLGDSGDTIIVTSGANFNTDAIKNLNTSSIITQTNATTITLGYSGSTIAIASGASQTGFGRTGTVNWDTTKKTTGFTAVNGVGYFCDTTSGAFTMTLPATPTAGDIVALKDYANTFDTNNLTIGGNGSNINGSAGNGIISVQGQSLTLIYIDATQGWSAIYGATDSDLPAPTFVAATGGTITTCGNYKIHTFTGPGTFTVTSVGNPQGSTTVDYLVVAGGAGSGDYFGAGGGAGGFRESVPSPAAWTASPLANPGGAVPVSVQGYPVTVGAGGTCVTRPGPNVGGAGGSSSVLGITSAGGGGGSGNDGGGSVTAANGGSGGGGGGSSAGTAGSGNTPPVSPPQGNPGGGNPGGAGGGGGGGATAAGTPGPTEGVGGAGAGTAFNPSPSVGTPGPSAPLRYFAGGGAGSYITGGGGGGVGGGGNNGGNNSPLSNGITNTGGGGGNESSTGGSGIVILRYKFQ